jgi:hypothetical protein
MPAPRMPSCRSRQIRLTRARTHYGVCPTAIELQEQGETLTHDSKVLWHRRAGFKKAPTEVGAKVRVGYNANPRGQTREKFAQRGFAKTLNRICEGTFLILVNVQRWAVQAASTFRSTVLGASRLTLDYAQWITGNTWFRACSGTLIRCHDGLIFRSGLLCLCHRCNAKQSNDKKQSNHGLSPNS